MLEIAREERQRAFDKGIQEGKLFEVRRIVIMIATAKLGEFDAGLRRRIEEATDIDQLQKVAHDISVAQDPSTIEEILGKL